MGVGWWRVGNHQLRNCSTSWEGAKLSDEGKLCRAFHFIARALNEILTKEIHELNQFDFVWFLYFSDFISSPPQSGAAGETGRSKTKWAKMWNSSTSKFVRKIFLKKQIKAYKQIILKNYPRHARHFPTDSLDCEKERKTFKTRSKNMEWSEKHCRRCCSEEGMRNTQNHFTSMHRHDLHPIISLEPWRKDTNHNYHHHQTNIL